MKTATPSRNASTLPASRMQEAFGQSQSLFIANAIVDQQGNFQIRNSIFPGMPASLNIYIAALGIGARGTAYTTVFYPNASSAQTAQMFTVAPGTQIRDLRIVIKTVPTYTIRGKIVVAPDEAKQHYLVTIGGENLSLTGMPQKDASLVRADGSFTIREVPAGDYTLTVQEASRMPSFDMVRYQSIGPPLAAVDVHVTNSDKEVSIPIGSASAAICARRKSSSA